MSTTMSTDRLKLEDLLFSRTDTRGVIEAGNAVFQQISVYSWDQLIGAPHKILRHPDMPSGVFHIMWEMIKAGQPVGAYIQNRAEDGVPYWVFATLLPLEGGYISQQIKPSVGVLDEIIPLYERLRALERSGDLNPQQSAEQLVANLKEHDYTDYAHFMTYALREEVASRETILGRPGDGMRDRLAEMLIDIRGMELSAVKVDHTFRATHQIPYNMRLQAGRLEGSDGPISVISGNHRQMTQMLEENLERFGRDSKVGAEAIRMAMFKTSASMLIDEMAKTFKAEAELESRFPGDMEVESKHLEALAHQYRGEAREEVRDLSLNVQRFSQQCRDMRRMMSGLELTRIMCKIERSKFDGEHAGLDEIVNRLSEAQKTLGTAFDSILEHTARILDQGEIIQRSTQDSSAAIVTKNVA